MRILHHDILMMYQSIRVHTIFQVRPWWWAAAAPVMLSASLCWVCCSPSPCWPPSSSPTSQSPPPAPMWPTHPSPPPAPPSCTLPSPGSMWSLTPVTRTGSLMMSQNRWGTLCRKCSMLHLNNLFFFKELDVFIDGLIYNVEQTSVVTLTIACLNIVTNIFLMIGSCCKLRWIFISRSYKVFSSSCVF